MDNWVEKYRPQKLSDIVGNFSAIEKLLEWANSWKEDNPKSNAVILYGKQGVGKTSSIYALANDMGWEVTELNASDYRKKLDIENIAGKSSLRGTAIGETSKVKRIILLDEADNLQSREDKGGESAVIKVITNTKQPVVLTANEYYDMSYALRMSCLPIKFEPINVNVVIRILKEIAKSENVIYENGVIEKIAYNSDGDLRGAINDLQSVSSNTSTIKLEDVTIGERGNKTDIFSTLNKIFRASNIKESHDACLNIDEDPEELIQWIDENIFVEYKRPEELEDAYYHMSQAAIFLGRVRRRGNYGMLKYARFFMTSGVFSSSKKRRTERLRYEKPQIITRMWKTKNMRTTRDSLSNKIGVRCHTSTGFARSSLLPFFRYTARNISFAEYIATSLDLNIEEIAFIMNLSSEDKKVQDIYNKVQKTLREGTEVEILSSDEIEQKMEEERSIGKYGKAQRTIDDAWGM